MYCPRCKGHMIVMERSIQPNSTQTWYECTTCNGQRLLSADRLRYPDVWGQSAVSRFHAESWTTSDLETGSRLPRQFTPVS